MIIDCNYFQMKHYIDISIEKYNCLITKTHDIVLSYLCTNIF